MGNKLEISSCQILLIYLFMLTVNEIPGIISSECLNQNSKTFGVKSRNKTIDCIRLWPSEKRSCHPLRDRSLKYTL